MSTIFKDRLQHKYSFTKHSLKKLSTCIEIKMKSKFQNLGTAGISEAVVGLSSKHKALSSNFSTTKKKRRLLRLFPK
jgi:hypothetical protein